MPRCLSCNALGHYNVGQLMYTKDGERVRIIAGPFYSSSSAEKKSEEIETETHKPMTVVDGKSPGGSPLHYVCEVL